MSLPSLAACFNFGNHVTISPNLTILKPLLTLISYLI